MAEKQLTVVAEMAARPGKEDELERRLLALIEPTRKEEGCVEYILHRSTNEAGRFVFLENWTGADTLDRHLASPHLKDFLAAARDLLAEPPRIGRYERIA